MTRMEETPRSPHVRSLVLVSLVKISQDRRTSWLKRMQDYVSPPPPPPPAPSRVPAALAAGGAAAGLGGGALLAHPQIQGQLGAALAGGGDVPVPLPETSGARAAADAAAAGALDLDLGDVDRSVSGTLGELLSTSRPGETDFLR